ncbi:MAG: PaaI family thioesterase [Rhodospirillaceae bacterium]|nr:PaaI family thioesterase [Rhodospirillaceae bacterium]
MPQPPRITVAEELIRQYVGIIPHVAELKIEMVHSARGMAIMKLPYQERLVGNPETGVIHGGAVTTLIDTVCGLATITAPDEPSRIVTLDLRIDYLRPATPKRDLFARAEVYKLTRNVAFLRAEAYEDDPRDLVASATSTFMFVRGSARRSKGSAT